jgi:hypothetical protein
MAASQALKLSLLEDRIHVPIIKNLEMKYLFHTCTDTVDNI